jgi:4-oxalocrotonate tautomerase
MGADSVPLIGIKVFEDEFTTQQTREMVEAVTDTMVRFTGEPVRSATWVIVEEVKSGRWGSAARRSDCRMSGHCKRRGRVDLPRG